MYLYLISQNDFGGYDTYDSAVVAAESMNDAQNTHPGGKDRWDSYTWTQNPSNVEVRFIGVAQDNKKAGVICASFNAG
jgi:hypothetical protein